MATSVLGVGIPATSSLTPVEMQPALQKALDIMESDMTASPYDWEMFYFTPDMPFDLWVAKLREKKWDVVMVGMGLRKLDPLTPFFERIVNAVHMELPNAKFAFNTSIERTKEAVTRALDADR